MNLRVEDGRAESAPQLTTAVREELSATKVILRSEQALKREREQHARQRQEHDKHSPLCQSCITCFGCGAMQEKSTTTRGMCDGDLINIHSQQRKSQ